MHTTSQETLSLAFRSGPIMAKDGAWFFPSFGSAASPGLRFLFFG
jgi:hypothetical protein